MPAWLLIGTALAGYGDPVDGRPSLLERELHLWTNAVRVDPEAFADSYGCSIEAFSVDERTPKSPLAWSDPLGEAARAHADDMNEHEFVGHTSSDGTSFDERLARYYTAQPVGENVAGGYQTPFSVVMDGWMCSTEGHRAAIMSGEYTELGVGISDEYYAQDFGAGVGRAGPIAMGVHVRDGQDFTFLADYHDTHDRAPDSVEVRIGADRHAMELRYGDASNGVYAADVALEDYRCVPYAFVAIVAGETTVFPETGWFGIGDCPYDDQAAGWLQRDDDRAPGGCAATGATGYSAWPLGVAVLARRRRGERGGA